MKPPPAQSRGSRATATKTDTPLLETAASISVVSAAEVARRGGATNVGEALAYTPGVWLDPSFAVTADSGFSIRGFNTWGSNYLDGLKVGTGMTRAGQPSVEPFGMERFDLSLGYDFGASNPQLEGLTVDLTARNLGAGEQTQCTAWGCYYIEQPSAGPGRVWPWHH